MSRIKSQLCFGQWPEAREHEHHHAGLTVAARRHADSALDDEGRARFRAIRDLPPAAKRIVETHGDVIEVYLREKESNQR